MTIFSFGLEWDSITLAEKVREQFLNRKLTDKRGNKNDSIIMGMSEEGKTAFIVEGFDQKRMFGLVVTLPNYKKEVHIMGGKYDGKAGMKAKYNKTFSNLSQASKYFEEALNEYDKEVFKK